MSGLDRDRKRNQTISFRMSPEERRQMEARILVSGMPKGQYFIESLLHQKIQITGGKYQSDRLAMEFKRLRQQFEKDGEEAEEVALNCKALLDQLVQVLEVKEEITHGK